jgi:hypothetical protein
MMIPLAKVHFRRVYPPTSRILIWFVFVAAFLVDLKGLPLAGGELESIGAPASLLSRSAILPNSQDTSLGSNTREKPCLSVEDEITLSRRSLEILPMDHPLRGACLYDLSRYLFSRFKRSADSADLRVSIIRAREALDCLSDPNNPLYPSCRLLIEGASCILDVDDQTESQLPTPANQRVSSEHSTSEHMHPVVDLLPDSLDRPFKLLVQGMLLRRRFLQSRDTGDINEAIEKMHQAVLSLEGPDRPWYLSELGTSLSARFERFGDVKDIDEAITIERVMVELALPDNPDHLSNLGELLRHRFERL